MSFKVTKYTEGKGRGSTSTSSRTPTPTRHLVPTFAETCSFFPAPFGSIIYLLDIAINKKGENQKKRTCTYG